VHEKHQHNCGNDFQKSNVMQFVYHIGIGLVKDTK
jgi:hypothetical protein